MEKEKLSLSAVVNCTAPLIQYYKDLGLLLP